MNEIAITVTGKSGSGKSLIAAIIEQALKAQGFGVNLTLLDGESVDFYLNSHMDEIIEAVKKNSVIKIQELPLQRGIL